VSFTRDKKGRVVQALLSFAAAGALLCGGAAQAKVEYSEAEAEAACARFAPKPSGEAIFERPEVHRDTMGGLGFVCRVFLEGKTPDQNIVLSIMVSGMSGSVQRFKEGRRLVAGPSTRVDGIGDEAVAIAEYQDGRVARLVIEGVKGPGYFQLLTEPPEMSDAFFAKCAEFMRGFVAKLSLD
jgi:hypothetical protein